VKNWKPPIDLSPALDEMERRSGAGIASATLRRSRRTGQKHALRMARSGTGEVLDR
jgi:hypothetical protein